MPWAWTTEVVSPRDRADLEYWFFYKPSGQQGCFHLFLAGFKILNGEWFTALTECQLPLTILLECAIILMAILHKVRPVHLVTSLSCCFPKNTTQAADNFYRL